MVSESEINQKPFTTSDLEKIRKALCEAVNAFRGKKLTRTQETLQQFIHGVWYLTEDMIKHMTRK